MSTEQSFETERIDHLGIVAEICHEIGLMEAIDQVLVPQTRYPGPGRPAASATPNVVSYQLEGQVLQSEEALENALTSLQHLYATGQAWNGLAQHRLDTDSKTFVTQYGGYNSARQLGWMKYPADASGNTGEQVNYSYHPQGSLSRVVGDSSYANALDYNAYGQPVRIERGSNQLISKLTY